MVKALWAAAVLRLRPPRAWLAPLIERASELLPGGAAAPSPPLSLPPPRGEARRPDPRQDTATDLDPLELLYVTRCCDMLYRSLSAPASAAAGPGAGAAASGPPPPGFGGPLGMADSAASAARAAGGQTDEYEQFGPPPALAALVSLGRAS